MDATIENVTPTKAEKYLNLNSSNRKLRPGVAEKYARCLRDGTWTECPEPISFYEDNEVADGQHRLWAIVDSGVAVRCVIVRGLPRSAGLNINTGLARTLVDNSRIAGLGDDLSNELLATSRAVEVGAATSRAQSYSERLAYVDKHREASKWAMANGPRGRGLRNAITLAAVARAYYHEPDKDRLHRFGDVVSTGFSDGNYESAAIAIRNYLQAKGAQAASQALWRDTFLKVQNAIRYFMLSRPLTVIKVVSDEAYPLGRNVKPQSKAGNREKR